LVLDRSGNGKIDNGQEMFGNYTAQPKCSDPNGFLALAEFDKSENGGNADGFIDIHDSIYTALRVWIDENHNGTSESGELLNLTDVGLLSLSLNFKASGKRDRYGNRYRFWANVTGDSSQNASVGKYAWDVYLTSLPPVPDAAQLKFQKEHTIDGAQNPEQIPTEIAQEIFLRVASCSDDDPALYKKKCSLVHRAIGLDLEDEDIVPKHLAGLRTQLADLDDQIGDLRREKDPQKVAKRDSLTKQRHSLIKNKVEGLRQKLSVEGRQRLDAYIERMKAKIKFVPSPPTETLSEIRRTKKEKSL